MRTTRKCYGKAWNGVGDHDACEHVLCARLIKLLPGHGSLRLDVPFSATEDKLTSTDLGLPISDYKTIKMPQFKSMPASLRSENLC